MNSDYLVTAWDENKLVGLVNAFSDNTAVVYVHYVVTHKDYQNRGIGSRMLREILAKVPDYKHAVLVSNNDRIGFFQKCGFALSEGASAMEIRK